MGNVSYNLLVCHFVMSLLLAFGSQGVQVRGTKRPRAAVTNLSRGHPYFSRGAGLEMARVDEKVESKSPCLFSGKLP